MNRSLASIVLACSIAIASCSSEDGEPNGHSAPSSELDGYGLFADARKQIPAGGVIPFDVISSLYADEALKYRFVRIPEGAKIRYRNDEPWEWPDGSVLVKTFSFPIDARDPSLGERLIETRLLIKDEGAWTARVYLWNEEQSTTERIRIGARVNVDWVDGDGQERALEYRVPNENQCTLCHSTKHALEPLGPRTRQLARSYDYGDGRGPVDQIEAWRDLGLLEGDIPKTGERPKLADPFRDAPLEARALSYLEANCAHCHRPGGAASGTNLILGVDAEGPDDYGVCRAPVAAGPATGGLLYDIFPGKPDESILLYRMLSTAPEIKMPQILTQTRDEAGVELIREWIAAMSFAPCGSERD